MTERVPAAETALAEAALAPPVHLSMESVNSVPPSPPPAVSPPSIATPPEPATPPAPVAVPVLVPVAMSIAQTAGSDPAAATIAEDRDAAGLVDGVLWQDIWLQVPSWMTSMVVHLSIVLVLALITTTKYVMPQLGDVTVSTGENGPPGDGALQDQLMQTPAGIDNSSDKPLSPPEISDLAASAPLAELIGDTPAPPEVAFDLKLPAGDKGLNGIIGGGTGGDAPAGNGDGSGNSLELRLSGTHREQALRSGGGTAQSEKAVAMALHWLSEHQNYDGSWSYNHARSPKCHGTCSEPGFCPGKIAATAMALLPFLGTGQTHKEGQYRRTIDQGLKFLVRSMEVDGKLGSLYEVGGQMYGHGLAAIVLCEAYGMTHDPQLQTAAQSAVNFIVEAQDPLGGGWRYLPRQPGDTSVVGWQLMALKSAQMAYLRVPPNTMRKADYFLDHVQSDRGATYGYTGPEMRRPATTAIGLLSRMYLGWKREMEPLQRGVQIISTLGPSTNTTANKNNMYYNYYATQLMHHWGGYPWQRWNEVMREYLIKSQATRGHETGSWFLDGADHGISQGGRLYCTAMAAMTLEVYYRYMPLYRDQSTQ
jgi:hypothetical protein